MSRPDDHQRPMSLNSLTEGDIERLLDKALELGGIRLPCATLAEARSFRFRVYQMRKKMRRESRRLYTPDEWGWGRCKYDDLIVRVLSNPAEVMLVRGGYTHDSPIRGWTLDGKEIDL